MIRYCLIVTPNAKIQKVEATAKGFKVWLHAPAVEGKANAALIQLMATHLGLKKRQLSLEKGQKSRNKILLVQPE